MSKSDKVLYGIFSFLPLALVVGFFVSIMGSLHSLMESAAWKSGNPRKMLPYLPDLLSSTFTLLLLLLITTIALLVTFITHVIKNRTVSNYERTIWIAAFVFGGAIAFPLYFLIRIWHVQSQSQVLEHRS